MADPSHVFDLAKALREHVAAHFGAENVDLPDRQFVANGAVALDCPQLAVQIVRIYVGLPSNEHGGPSRHHSLARTVEMAVWLTRCVPTVKDAGGIPTADELETSAEELLTDAWTLSGAMTEATKNGVFEPCTEVALRDLLPLGPEGGHGGWQQRVRVQV